LILVTGSLGASALGLALLKRGINAGAAQNDAQAEAIGWHLLPQPRVTFGRELGARGLASSMIDVSDGLSTDLWHLLDESGCGARIKADAIPVAHCLSELAPVEGLDPLTTALNSGEEYELLFTATPDNTQRVLELAESLNEPITVIGEIIDNRRAIITSGDSVRDLSPSGFEHRF
jgi:thiamine-monophosphate kinase